VDDIKAALYAAARDKRKTAMFHLQILRNATELEGVDPTDFCRELGLRASFAAEFRKMLALARLMKEKGIRLVE
jgi:hypothetical protein